MTKATLTNASSKLLHCDRPKIQHTVTISKHTHMATVTAIKHITGGFEIRQLCTLVVVLERLPIYWVLGKKQKLCPQVQDAKDWWLRKHLKS